MPVFVTADSVLQVFYSLADDIVVHVEREAIGPVCVPCWEACPIPRYSRMHLGTYASTWRSERGWLTRNGRLPRT